MAIGKKRYVADTLRQLGEVDCNVLASALRVIASYADKTLMFISDGSTWISPTHAEGLLAQNPGIRDSVKYAATYKKEGCNLTCSLLL